MYGQTTGRGAQALAELRKAYPVSMDFLDEADREARGGHDLITYGGRRLRMDNRGDFELPEQAARSRTAARGRYGRNAVVQGAAAELFKMWAVTVRARAAEFGAQVVLCLHDELLVHAPSEMGEQVAGLVDSALDETARRWAPNGSVRFLADTSIITRWSDAKD
jgi:DNA polymerase-1